PLPLIRIPSVLRDCDRWLANESSVESIKPCVLPSACGASVFHGSPPASHRSFAGVASSFHSFLLFLIQSL
ncbi:hypothetical protein HAX54_011825, partial [Datura stramonium]|nr:hypothetical protein [Datura stramonium]